MTNMPIRAVLPSPTNQDRTLARAAAMKLITMCRWRKTNVRKDGSERVTAYNSKSMCFSESSAAVNKKHTHNANVRDMSYTLTSKRNANFSKIQNKYQNII
jgi:hypothetical protein